jgi:hypothetical protein
MCVNSNMGKVGKIPSSCFQQFAALRAEAEVSFQCSISVCHHNKLYAIYSAASRSSGNEFFFVSRPGFLKLWYASFCSVVHGLNKEKIEGRKSLKSFNKFSYIENLIKLFSINIEKIITDGN